MNQANVKVSFYLKKSEVDADGDCPVRAVREPPLPMPLHSKLIITEFITVFIRLLANYLII